MTKMLFAITHIGSIGLRQLTFANQAQHHYETLDEAQKALKLYEPALRGSVLGNPTADTLEVHLVPCNEDGTAVQIYLSQ